MSREHMVLYRHSVIWLFTPSILTRRNSGSRDLLLVSVLHNLESSVSFASLFFVVQVSFTR